MAINIVFLLLNTLLCTQVWKNMRKVNPNKKFKESVFSSFHLFWGMQRNNMVILALLSPILMEYASRCRFPNY